MFTLGRHLSVVCMLASISVQVSVAQQTNLLTVGPAVAQLPQTGVGVPIGPQQVVYIYNPGQTPVAIKSISITGPNAADFAVSNTFSPCPLAPARLQPGETCYPSLTFTPSSPGTRVARLVVAVAGGGTQSAALVGLGLPDFKSMSFNVPDIAFQATPIGVPVQFAPFAFVYVTNTGTVPVNIQSVALSDSQNFSISNTTCSGSLQLGGNCYTTVLFEPVSTGPHAAKLIVFDDAPGGSQRLPITGIGTAATKTLQAFPTYVDFGNVTLANPQQIQVVLQNTGSESLVITGGTITGQNASDFTIVSNTCRPSPFTLASFAECSLQIQFTPAALGARLASLNIFDTASGSPQTVPLVGSGSAAVTSMAFSYSLVNLGLVPEGVTSSSSGILQNTGNTTLSAPSLSLQGGSSDFQITSQCSDIPAGSYCYVPVTFTPSRVGMQAATLVATEPTTGQSVSATLVGAGEASGAALGAYQPLFSPEAVGVTGPIATATLINNSSSAVTINNVSISGGAQTDYGIFQNGCPNGTVLNAFAQCVIQLTFTPSSVGARVSALSVSYTGAALEIPLAGTGLPLTRVISFGGLASLDVGPQPLGTSFSTTVTISNTGDAPLSISRVSIQGANAADWAMTGNGCPAAPATLAAAAYCYVTLQFTPSAAGTRAARLQLNDDATGSPQSLELNGFGSTTIQPPVSISSMLNFNPQILGTSFQQVISVFNEAQYAVPISNVSISGPNVSDFQMANSCGSSLPGNTPCYIYITFTPLVTGLRVAQVQFTYGPNGTLATVPITGFGVTATASISFTPTLAAIPLAVAVGYSASTSITITNTGNENVTLSKFKIGGAAHGDFGIQSNNCPLSPAPLIPGGNCSITITFAPTVTGTRIATFQVTDSSPGSPHTISLVGQAVVPVKTLQFNPTSLSFGAGPVGVPIFGILNLFNSGTAPVTFSGFGISGPNAADFSINANFCAGYINTLDPGITCEIFFYFTPSATGARSATLQVTSDASNSPGLVAFSGTGQ